MSWKLFWSGLGASMTLSAGVAVRVTGPPWWQVALIGLAAATGVTILAQWEIHRTRLIVDTMKLRYSTRTTAIRWICVAAIAHVSLLTLAAAFPDKWPQWTTVLALFAGSEYWIARAIEYHATLSPTAAELAQRHSANPDDADGVQGEATAETAAHAVGQAIIGTAGFGWMRLMDVHGIGDRGADGIVILAAMPTRSDRAGGNKVDADAAREIAIAAQAILRRPIRTQWVQIRPDDAYGAGTFRIAIVVRDVLADIRPLPLNTHPTSLNEMCTVGYSIEGGAVGLYLRQHGQVIGRTGSGKSALVLVLLIFTIRARALNWVCGTQKLLDLVGPLLQPYAEHGETSPLDWIAPGMDKTMDMLLVAAVIIQGRQKLPPQRRQGLAPIRITLDEAQRVLQNRNPRYQRFFDGRPHFATDLWAYIMETGLSASVYGTTATQHGLHSKHGDQGSDITANRGFVAVFDSGDHSEIGRQLGYDKWKETKPPHTGTCWLNRGTVPPGMPATPDDDPAQKLFLLRVLYGQEPAPKPRLHDGPTISEIAWELRHLIASLDEISTDIAAPAAHGAYAHRLTDAAAVLADIQLAGQHQATGDPADHNHADAQTADVDQPKTAGPMTIEEEANLLVQTQMATWTAQATSGSPVGNLTQLSQRRTRRDRIVAIVNQAGGPITTAEIAAALRADGDEVRNLNALTNALRDLVDGGLVDRPTKGVYQPRGAA